MKLFILQILLIKKPTKFQETCTFSVKSHDFHTFSTRLFVKNDPEVQAAVEEINYVSFVLRIWPVPGDGCVIWRASLENSQTCERVGFYNLEALFTYIEEIFPQKKDPEQFERNMQ